MMMKEFFYMYVEDARSKIKFDQKCDPRVILNGTNTNQQYK